MLFLQHCVLLLLQVARGGGGEGGEEEEENGSRKGEGMQRNWGTERTKSVH